MSKQKTKANAMQQHIPILDELDEDFDGWALRSTFPTKETSFQGYGRQTPRAPRLDEIESGEHGAWQSSWIVGGE